MRNISIFKLTASNKIFILLFIARPIYEEKRRKTEIPSDHTIIIVVAERGNKIVSYGRIVMRLMSQLN